MTLAAVDLPAPRQLRVLHRDAPLPLRDVDHHQDHQHVHAREQDELQDLQQSTGEICKFAHKDERTELTKTVRTTGRPYELEVLATVTNRSNEALRHALRLRPEFLDALRRVLASLVREVDARVRARGIESYQALLHDTRRLLEGHQVFYLLD